MHLTLAAEAMRPPVTAHSESVLSALRFCGQHTDSLCNKCVSSICMFDDIYVCQFRKWITLSSKYNKMLLSLKGNYVFFFATVIFQLNNLKF